MKTLQILSFLAVGALVSCSQSGNQANKNTDSLKTAGVITGDLCYQKAIGRDTIQLQLHIQDTVISGQLTYNHFEKDKNTGTIAGKIHNNFIYAQYTFISEGAISTRPVVFHLMDDKAYEAVADSINPEGVPVFTDDTAVLKFEVEPLLKISCSQIGVK
ncbi:hypothetical protein [Chitinophaga sp. HK235]|uniref:hypothetical protein n=1 Tax=Chitinophaga sp. HK235 TaxID=2952571 RepID=UPI001BAA2FF7|nr:hypothetical protein [Chitinophaga sp. HK235]